MAVQPGLCRSWSENPEDRFSHEAAQMQSMNTDQEQAATRYSVLDWQEFAVENTISNGF